MLAARFGDDGGMDTLRELARATHRELRQAVRRLRFVPGFAVLAIATLAIGIGINTAMLSIMDALLLRPPFHVADPDNVVRILYRSSDSPEATLYEASSYPTLVDVQSSGAFADAAGYAPASVSIDQGAAAVLGSAMAVTSNFFDVLGTRPHAGTFAWTSSSGTSSVVVSYDFWQRRFAGDARAVGAQLSIDGKPYVVAGVAPRGFAGLHARPIDLWLPLEHVAGSLFAQTWRENRRSFWLSTVARLRAGASVAGANERASAVLRQRQAEMGRRRGPVSIATASIVPGREGSQTREARVALWLTGVTTFVLLIACANVSNLVLARNIGRRRDYAIRLSLGASRRRLAGQLLADVAVLVVPGGALALWVSYIVRNGIPAVLSAEIPVSVALWDPRTTWILLGGVVLAFAAVSMLSLTQVHAATFAGTLTTAASTAAPSGARVRSTLLAVQAGLCLVLLFLAGLFARSLERVQALDLGLQLDRTLQITIDLQRAGKSPEVIRSYYDRAVARLEAHPAVERVSVAQSSPYMSGTGVSPRTANRSHEELWGDRESAYTSVVGAGFFTAVAAPSLRGRDFTKDDNIGAPRVAIINAPLARHLWPSGEALGECMYLDDSTDCVRVVGVLGGVWKFRALARDKMAVYLPLAQSAEPQPGAIFVRPKGDPRAFLREARALLQTIDPTFPAVRAVVAIDLTASEFKPWRLGATMFSVFGSIAMIIAGIGLYGVVSLGTAMRLREIGIRLALGARWPHVLGLVVAEAVVAVGAGLLAAVAIIRIASPWLGELLYETSPNDPVILLQTALVLLLVSAAAAAVPAARALRTNPARVLLSG